MLHVELTEMVELNQQTDMHEIEVEGKKIKLRAGDDKAKAESSWLSFLFFNGAAGEVSFVVEKRACGDVRCI